MVLDYRRSADYRVVRLLYGFLFLPYLITCVLRITPTVLTLGDEVRYHSIPIAPTLPLYKRNAHDVTV